MTLDIYGNGATGILFSIENQEFKEKIDEQNL